MLKKIEYGSLDYDQAVALRFEILRRPLGLVFTSAELERDKLAFHFAAFKQSQIIGCLSLSPLSQTCLKMRQVAIHASHQGQGIGKKLVRFSEQWAKKNDYQEIELNARETAVPFYLAQGYALIGDHFIEVGIVHRKMLKVLI